MAHMEPLIHQHALVGERHQCTPLCRCLHMHTWMQAQIRAPTFSSRSLTHERWPSKQAVISGVNPCLSGACGRRGWERNEWEEEDFWSLEGKQRLYIVTLLNPCFKKSCDLQIPILSKGWDAPCWCASAECKEDLETSYSWLLELKHPCLIVNY